MKLLVLSIALLAFASADVSHLNQQHPGYSYDPPAERFELPTPTYLPPEPEPEPEVPSTPTPTYLPPEPPAPTYLPPSTARPAPPPPPPPPPPAKPRTTVPPPPPPTPANEYLAPTQKEFAIPLPSYADSFLESDVSPQTAYEAPAEPENKYLPPEKNDGYHYDAPALRFYY